MGTTADQTALAADINIEQKFTDTNIPAADILWEYNNKDTVLGIPVQQQSKKLPFDTQDNLFQALQTDNNIKIWSGYLSPQFTQDMQVYKNIRQKIADGTAYLISQDKQFVPQKKAFLCVLVYNQLSYKLNQRYNFYKQELTNG